MSFSLLRRMGIPLVLGSVMVCITGCGKTVSGVYADDANLLSIDFKSGGKATVTIGGTALDADYTVNGKTVTVKSNGDTKVFTINDDGSLAGPGTTLKKK